MTYEDFLCRSLSLVRQTFGDTGALLWDDEQHRFVVVELVDGQISEAPPAVKLPERE